MLVRAPDSPSKGCEFESRQERRKNVLLHNQVCVLTLIRFPFRSRVTAVARKGPRSFCQKCRWQVTPKHAHTFDPTKSEWADHAAVQAECGNLSGNELTRNWSGNTHPQSSQLAEPLWDDPWSKEWSWCKQANPRLTTTTTKGGGRENRISEPRFLEPSPIILAGEEKATATTADCFVLMFMSWLSWD